MHSITVDPHQSDAYRLAGIYFYRSGRFLEAIVNLNMALANDPDGSESALHLMMAYYFVNDQNAYLQVIDRLRSVDQRVLLSFAAREFYSHGFYAETIKIIEQSKRLFQNDPAMMALSEAARAQMPNLPK